MHRITNRHANGLSLGPTRPTREAIRNKANEIIPIFFTSTTSFHDFKTTYRRIDNVAFQMQFKLEAYSLISCGLMSFDWQAIVGLPVDHPFRGLCLIPHRVDRDPSPRNIDDLQQFRNGRHFVAFGVHNICPSVTRFLVAHALTM
jgi:hypothetical protein